MSALLRILLIEDSTTDAKVLLAALRGLDRVIESTRVQDRDSLIAALDAQTWDAIISDWSMPNFSGRAALDIVKSRAMDPPFIIVSGTVGEEMAVEAMRAGAHDYVLKDMLGRLPVALERELRDHELRKAHRAAQTALQSQAARFHALIEKSHDGMSMTGADGKSIYMSPAAERILGRTLEQREGESSFDRVHPDDRESARARFAEMLATPGASSTSEFRIVRPDGTVRWIETNTTNHLHDPALAALVSNSRDVTERKLALDEARASEARYRRIVETTNQGVWTVDTELNTTFANKRLADMLGYQPEALLGMPVLPFLVGDVRTLLESNPEELRRRFSTRTEYLLQRKDGSQFWALVDAAPILDEQGRVEGALALVTDISELHDAARMRDKLTADLEHELAERKRAEVALRLSEQQLRQSQKMEALGRLAGGVAHDFNNMLSVILSLTELMMMTAAPADSMREDLHEIHTAGKRAAELTRQLLMFSRQQVIAPSVLDMNEVVGSMDSMVRRLIGEDVALSVVAGQDLGKVLVDRGSIEQVIMNLAVNARDAMPTGGKLTLETANVELGADYAAAHVGAQVGPHLMLAVTDTGIGMDRATQARIFEPFFTTKEVGKGTGLGLSTVFGIVQQSQGSIWVYSEPGVGTTFKVYLPLVANAAATPRPAPETALLRGTETVLLVEDEDQLRSVARIILKRQGYTVLEARNADGALLLCEQHPKIALLLTDVVMPGMSGPALVRRLASAHPGMRVLCMSGYTDDSVVRHGVLEGSLAYLQKPITPDSLARKVREVLDAPAPQPA